MRSTVGSAGCARLLLASHIGFLVAGRVGVDDVELKIEGGIGGSAVIRPRPGSLRGEGERVTGATIYLVEGRRAEIDHT